MPRVLEIAIVVVFPGGLYFPAVHPTVHPNVHRNVHHNDGPFSAVIKTKDANVYLASLPRDALLVRADLDELFDAAPATIEAALREDGGFVRGRFVDRISGDWRLAPVAANRSLGAQFPRRCAATHGAGIVFIKI